MGTEKIIAGDLDEGTGVSGRQPPERRPVVEEEQPGPLSHDEMIDAEGPHTPEKSEHAEKSGKQGKKEFGRISFDKKNEFDIFSD